MIHKSHKEMEVAQSTKNIREIAEELMSDPRFTADAFTIASPNTGKTIHLGGTFHTFKLLGTDTANQFALMESIIQPHVLALPR